MGRSHAMPLENTVEASPPATPKAAYAINSLGRFISTAGIRNSGSDPRNQRMTTTLDTAERTTDPRIPAVQRPITSSITNSTAEIGALKAAAKPAAARSEEHT